MGGEPLGANSTTSRILALSGQQRAALGALLRRGAAGRYPAIPRCERTVEVPLSFGQQRLWFLDQWQPGNPAYNVPAIFSIPEPVNLDTVRRTLEEIGRRHASLRTRFRMADEQPVQDVMPGVELQLRVCAASSAPDADERLRELIHQEIRRPFSLERGPLFRAALFPGNGPENIVVLTVHHIVADGWSIGLLYQEFQAIYKAFGRGLPTPFADLPIQYTDFAIWQRQLGDNSLESQIGYWRQQLTGAPILELPSRYPRPAVPSHRGALHAFLISAELRDRLHELAIGENATMYMVLLAAFLILMHRYTGQEEIVVGSPVAGRSRPETEGLIGFFVNTLAIRVNTGGRPSFRECLGRVRKVVVEALANQDTPFERLVQELQLDRDLSRNPLFQVTFQLFTGPDADNRHETTVHRPIEIDKGTSVFDLAFNLWEDIGGVEGRIEYSTDLFDKGYVTRMAGHFVTLLESIAAGPGQRTNELDLLTEVEREQILGRWNDTYVALADRRCIHELVEEQARLRPDQTAVTGEGNSLSYAELNYRADRVALRLRELGVGVEAPVAVCLERSPDLIAAMLGILKSGRAYVPIDAAYPLRRIESILGDSGAEVLITSESLFPDPKVIDRQVLLIDDLDEVAPENPGAECVSRPDALAYIIYTSGSTGTPKGVEVEHGALCNLVDWHRRTYAVTDKDRASQVASISFDAAVWEIWPYLAAGGCVCIVDDDTRRDPGGMLAWLAEQRITICFLPTPMAEAVLIRDLPNELSLRAMLTGGDRLRYRPSRELPFELYNHYGPTENTVVATFAAVAAGPAGAHPAIGRPVSNNQIYILDPDMQPLPAGVPGEIYIGGASLARGYRNRPDLTAERFVVNPFDPGGSTRLYKTGDLGRFEPDGNIEFLGRSDRQVKIRGFRIEPGEVEAVLRGCPGIGEVLVTTREDTSGQNQLIAYLVRHAHGLLKDVRLYLSERLPDYMVPSVMVELESMPLTLNGKIDEGRLPRPAHAEVSEEKSEPGNAVEEVLLGIWAEVLKLDTITIHDNFFECGGHSLLSVLLVSRIREALQTDLPLRTIFEAPTVRRLAGKILVDPSEARRIEAVARMFLHFLDMQDQQEEEGSLSGTEESAR